MNGWERRKLWFLFTGLPKALCESGDGSKTKYDRRLIEPERAIRCRRIILATSATAIAAAINGSSPEEIRFFGITPEGVIGAITISLAIVLGQLYCWFIRYTEIAEDGEWESFSSDGRRIIERLGLLTEGEHDPPSRQKTANLVSNRLAAAGTSITWCIAGWWIWDALR